MDTKGSGLLDLRTMSLVTPGGHLIWYLPQSQEGRVHAYGPDSRFVLDGDEWHELPHEHLWAYEPVRYGAVGRDGLVYIFGYEGLYLHADVGHPEEGPPVLVFPTPAKEGEWQRYAFMLAPDGTVVLRARDVLLTGRVGPGPSLRLDTLAVVPWIAEARGWDLAVDRVGRVWLSLGKDGLVVVEGGEATRLLPNAEGVSEAGGGVIIVSTDDGIVGFDEATASLLFSLGKEDGLLMSVAGSGAMFYGDTLYVTHEQGLSLVPRSSLAASIPVPRVLLEARWTDERRRALELEFVATSYRVPGLIRYEYRLDEKGWEPAERTSLLLAGMAPGAHSVAVRARHEHGAFGPAVSHAFVVPTPFYRATWFTALLALLAVGVAAGGYRLRMQAVRRKEATLVALVHERTRRLAEAMQTLAEAKETTEEQARQLAELDRLKSRFFANISHELRTPLTLMIAPLTDVLADERGLAHWTRRAIEGPLQSARRLGELVDQILRLSRLEAGDARLDPRPEDLGALLRARVRAFAPVAASRRIVLEVDAPSESVVVRLDPEAMATVVDNLLSNALKYTPEGGRVRATLVLDDATPDGAHAVLAVEDTGPGIPPEALPHVFERFYRAADGEPGGATPSAGTGIGLDLAHELVLLHEGTIDVESEVGGGTVFTVRLPFEVGLETARPVVPEEDTSAGVAGDGLPAPSPRLEADALDVTDVPESGAEGASGVELDAPSVLIVEDNAAVRAYLAERLGRHFRVLTATDGVEGLASARAHAPDLVVSDVMMPRMDGLALCRALKADDALAATPVVLLTARASPEHAVEGLDAGADDYMEKPFESAELVARIRRHLARNAELSRRYGRRIFVGPEEVEATSADAAFLERLTFVLEERHHEASLSVEDVAFELGVSPRQFRRRLGALTAASPSEHLRGFRLERAAQLLGARAGTVSETAYRVGFSSARVFARQFKARFGCAPSAYEGPGGGPGGDGAVVA